MTALTAMERRVWQTTEAALQAFNDARHAERQRLRILAAIAECDRVHTPAEIAAAALALEVA